MQMIAKFADFLRAGPGGVASMENWEITWAKPIGPIKQAERQRCINEAISQSKTREIKSGKPGIRKRIPFQHEQIDNQQEVLDMYSAAVLIDYVSNKLNARCSFECLSSYNPSGYIHKVCLKCCSVIFQKLN